MAEKSAVSRNSMINQLLKIGHGDLSIYKDVGLKAIKDEPELFAHLIAYNFNKGEVKDSKRALPIIALRGDKDDELFENAVAHLCKLDPLELVRACRFHKELGPTSTGGSKWLKKGIYLYLKEREKKRKWWDRTALQHRDSLKTLYAMNHIRPNGYAQSILFYKNYPESSVFHQVKCLKNMTPIEAAGTILNYQIPYLIAVGAVGGIKNKPDIILALIERMSGNELITNTNMLKQYGVFENPILKAAYDKAVERMKKDKKVPTLKAGRAASVIKDKKIADKLETIQEERLAKLGGIDGDIVVLGDKSGSMTSSIEVAKQIAALIAQQIKGRVHLIFFDSQPTYFDVTGKSLSEIQEITKRISARGSTSIGCGLDYLMKKNEVVNGIVICSDGGDNYTPHFHDAYEKYCIKFEIEPTIYLLHVPGDKNYLAGFCKSKNISMTTFELGEYVDYYSLPNLINSIRINPYALIDEIMETPLLTFNDVFGKNHVLA